MNPDQLMRVVLGKVKAARVALKRDQLQATVDLIEGAQADLKEAVWLLERKIAHQQMHDCKSEHGGDRL